METPKLPTPKWATDILQQLNLIYRDIRAREALGAANEAVRRLRDHRHKLLTENSALRAELKKARAENDELQQIIIKKLNG